MTALQPSAMRLPLAQQAKRQWTIWRRGLGLLATVGHGFGMAITSGAMVEPNQPQHTALVQEFCRRMCRSLGVTVELHGEMPREHALWVANHISWIDIPVIGSLARVFFLGKAEIADYPIFGRLARAGGSVFVRRGSGDANQVSDQVAGFLRQKLPILFFPEATTTDGRQVKRIHGKILRAALETGTRIQPVVICYVTPDGQLDLVVPFIDDVSLGEHIQQVLVHPQVTVHVLPLAAIDPEGHNIHSLTDLLQAQMRQGLATLQAKVLRVAPIL
ncbi:MAG: lysophospholipid acyltransferase family protein [Pseudomonadota bacterium]|nr:lysophospholipid acyltransferase family protein [Pseudomonadota bacterium]